MSFSIASRVTFPEGETTLRYQQFGAPTFRRHSEMSVPCVRKKSCIQVSTFGCGFAGMSRPPAAFPSYARLAGLIPKNDKNLSIPRKNRILLSNGLSQPFVMQ